ncbi:MAG TPA: ATP-binding cassette domain-containing protein [Thermoanaerobaculia bacterium]|nr:ATP-binding cassette domain-containing protein [Thermoanaerobaculia bacterium]
MLQISHAAKSFGANRAVDDVSLTIQGGEIVGLVGENGAGKTTLMRIAAGELAADAGTIEFEGRIGFVHQHFMLVNDFTIAENLALATRTAARDAEKIIASTGIALPHVERRAGDLGVGEKAKLELIKAIAREPSLLILDEPTSVLTPYESDELFAVMRTLAAKGTAIVFITHKIREVTAVATRVVVMRRGSIVADSPSMSAEEIARLMTLAPRSGERVAEGRVRGDSQGEILAIVGVAGNGQRELAEQFLHAHPRSRIGFIPEDRTHDGIVAEMSIAENIALTHEHWREAMRRAPALIDLYSIKAQSAKQPAGSLSGGNQQKVILARELDGEPERIVASEPTRGLDLESTRFVREQLREAAARGAHVILITSDLDEAFELADGIQVIYRGVLSDRMSPAVASERVAKLMAGLQ